MVELLPVEDRGSLGHRRFDCISSLRIRLHRTPSFSRHALDFLPSGVQFTRSLRITTIFSAHFIHILRLIQALASIPRCLLQWPAAMTARLAIPHIMWQITAMRD